MTKQLTTVIGYDHCVLAKNTYNADCHVSWSNVVSSSNAVDFFACSTSKRNNFTNCFQQDMKASMLLVIVLLATMALGLGPKFTGQRRIQKRAAEEGTPKHTGERGLQKRETGEGNPDHTGERGLQKRETGEGNPDHTGERGLQKRETGDGGPNQTG